MINDKLKEKIINDNKYFFNIAKNQNFIPYFEEDNNEILITLSYDDDYHIEDFNATLELFLNNKIESIPNNLIINGDLIITLDNKLKKIGKGLTVNGDLILEEAISLEEIGDDLFVSGSLKIKECNNLHKLALNAKIIGNCYIYNHSKNNSFKFEKNITIKGDLYLNDKNLNIDYQFSNGFKLEQNLIIKNIQLHNLHQADINNIIMCLSEEIYEDHITNKNNNNNCHNDCYHLNQIELDKIIEDNIINNFLELYCPNKLYSKLLNCQFNDWCKEELNQLINKEYVLQNNNKVDMFHYCRSKRAFNFLYQNNYHFTEEEYKTIQCDEIKNIYEMYLLKNKNNCLTQYQ